MFIFYDIHISHFSSLTIFISYHILPLQYLYISYNIRLLRYVVHLIPRSNYAFRFMLTNTVIKHQLSYSIRSLENSAVHNIIPDRASIIFINSSLQIFLFYDIHVLQYSLYSYDIQLLQYLISSDQFVFLWFVFPRIVANIVLQSAPPPEIFAYTIFISHHYYHFTIFYAKKT